jgi:hypothetical protein
LKGIGAAWALFVLAIAAGSAFVVLGSAGAEGDARRVLEAQGITVTQLGGYDFFACSDDDTFRTRFEGTGPTGLPVRGTVCAGFLKGATVRFQ